MDDEMFKGVQKFTPAQVQKFMDVELDDKDPELIIEQEEDIIKNVK